MLGHTPQQIMPASIMISAVLNDSGINTTHLIAPLEQHFFSRTNVQHFAVGYPPPPRRKSACTGTALLAKARLAAVQSPQSLRAGTGAYHFPESSYTAECTEANRLVRHPNLV